MYPLVKFCENRLGQLTKSSFSSIEEDEDKNLQF